MRLIARALTLVGTGLALSLGWGPLAAAQTIVQNNELACCLTGSGIGQSFTATLTGQVTQIQVRHAAAPVTTTVRFYNGAGSGTVGSIGTPVSSQPVDLVTTAQPGFQTIVLNTPLPIVAGQQYSFVFDGSANFAYDGNSYSGGSFVQDYNTLVNPVDLKFTVTEVVPPPAPVPTLSEWTMILLGLMLAGGAAIYIQRRQMAA